jgi:hypothetical protein
MILKRLLSTSAVMDVLAGVILLATSQFCAAQEAGSKAKSDDSPASTATTPPNSVDPRYGSPRATARTFLIAMNLAEDDPHKIDEATAYLDLSGIPLDILRLTERLGIAFDSPTLLLDRNGRASPALETGKGVTPLSQENRTRRSGCPDNGCQLARLVSGC